MYIYQGNILDLPTRLLYTEVISYDEGRHDAYSVPTEFREPPVVK